MLNTRGLFGSPRPSWMTPGINPDAPQVFDGPRLPQQPMPQQAQQAEKPWTDTTSGKLAMLGQILLSRGRNNPMLDVMQHKQMMQEQQRMAEQQRRAGFDDFVQRKTWERDNMPQGADPTSMQRNYEYLKATRPDLADQYLESQAVAPPLVVPNADGTRTIYSAGMIPRASSAPTAPVGKLTPIGGAVSNGGGSFRP